MNLAQALAATVCLLCVPLFVQSDLHAQTVLASGDPNALPTIDSVPFFMGGFSITRDVAYDGGSGQWHKELVGPGSSANSGDRRDIVETITNVGSQPWTDWHERVVSTTDIDTTGDPNDPGFLFDNDSLHVYRNNVLLTLGADYLVAPEIWTFGPMGNPGHWSAFDIFFQPGSTILPGDVLKIEKQIFEVFGDANPWRPNEIAVIAQYPTIPEPATWILASAGVMACSTRRRRVHSSLGPPAWKNNALNRR